MPTIVQSHLNAAAGAQLRGFGWTTYANEAALPVSGQPGEIVFVTATGRDYQYDPVESRWVPWGSIDRSAWKEPARVLSTTNVTVAAPGATIDGVAMAAGDRFVLAGQTTTSENGIYVYTGAATPATRALDLNSGTEANGANVFITQGTNADRQYQQTTDNVTVGTTAQTWTLVGPATGVAAASDTVAGVVELATNAEVITGTDATRAVTPASLAAVLADKGGSVLFGDGTATTYTLPHGITGVAATNDLLVRITVEATGFDVFCDVATDATNVVVTTVAAPTANQYRATWWTAV